MPYIKILPLLLVIGSAALGSTPNVLVLDSSFSPIKLKSGNSTPESCLVLNENNISLPDKGECYDKKTWLDVEKSDIVNLKGFQDILSGNKTTKAALQWSRISKNYPKQARKVRNQYIISTHGSRSAYIIDKFSNGRANILFLRNMSSGIGGNASISKGSRIKRSPYKNGCGFINWSLSDIKKFEHGDIQPYQRIISNTLNLNKSIRLANISLGYKQTWVQEDNPKCTKDQVSKEFTVLALSWQNLINKHPNVLFLAASGNESENFDNPKLRDNDLWGKLSRYELTNLIIVGSLYENGTRYRSSNYGSVVEVMALGNNLEVNSPIPFEPNGHPTTVRGTSFSTPLVTGYAVKLLTKNISIKNLKNKIIEKFHSQRKKKLHNSFLKNCSVISADCILTIINLASGPYLWGDFHELFSKGKSSWGYRPFPIEYSENLNTAAKVKLVKFKGEYIPKLILGKPENPFDLLLSIHHELYHYSTISKSALHFHKKRKIKGCVTDYQLALGRDEKGAFLSEIEFFKQSEEWFKEAIKGLKLNSKLLKMKNSSYENYYKVLETNIKSQNNFILNRYIELNEYPACMKKLI